MGTPHTTTPRVCRRPPHTRGHPSCVYTWVQAAITLYRTAFRSAGKMADTRAVDSWLALRSHLPANGER
jgi:hypothetical protein